MPGYETERFVNLSATEKAELTCSICQDIFRSPVVANCCLQTFCEDCINDWLKTNKSCPYDRKELTSSLLTRPPRAMVNMLGKLKIKCDYREKGCKEVLILENLSQHLLSCRYNSDKTKKCKKCLCDAKSSHDCVKTLLELNKKANEEIDTLKKKIESTNIRPEASNGNSISNRFVALERETSLIRELRQLKLEKDNFLKTIQELSNSSDPKSISTKTSTSSQQLFRAGPKTTFTSSSEVSEQEIFSEARKHLLNPIITQNEMTKEVTNKLLSIVKEEIREYNSLFIVCKNIVEKSNQEFGNRWHCIASYNNSVNSFFSYESGFLIKIRFGKLFLEIYKTQFLNVQLLRQRFRAGKIKREITILRSDMRETMISDIKRITFGAIEKSESLTGISSEIKNQMEAKHGGHWQCFIFGYFGNFGIHHSVGKYISFELGELTITVFQSTT